MRRRMWTRCVVVGWMASTATAATALTPPQADRYVGMLNAADPVVRDRATEALAGGGVTARPAVIRALPTATPDAADRLRTVLLRTGPWDDVRRQVAGPAVPGNGPAIRRRNPLVGIRNGNDGNEGVRMAFAGYATLPVNERCERVENLQGTAAADALVRVLTADPSPSVRWSAANVVRLLFDMTPVVSPDAPPVDARTYGRPLADAVLALVTDDARADPTAYPAASVNGPLLAAAAWAARSVDPARADRLMDRALAVEVEAPSAFRGQSDFAFLWSADRAIDRNDVPAALDRFRQLAARTAYSAVEVPRAVSDLFALHADHGPMPGFDDDLRLYRPYVARPELLYCLGRVAGRHGGLASGPAVEAAFDAVALAAGGGSDDVHSAAGVFLFRHGWAEAADRELGAYLVLTGGQKADVYYALYAVANDRDDDAAAARYLEGAIRRRADAGDMSRTDRNGKVTPWTNDDARSEVEWHYLRAATNAGNREAALARATALLTLDERGEVLKHSPGMSADIVPVLVDAGQRARADACFNAAYAELARQAVEQPDNSMPKNDLAWLCARSDRKLEEADRLSTEAVRLDPADAACLDTRAEVLARLGHPAEAAAVEDRALAVRPHNVYMQRQLVRFRAEAAKRPPA